MSAPRMLFVNYAVDSIAATRAYFESLGFTYNDQFSDETTGCLVLSDRAFVMQLEKARFADFTPDRIADTRGAEGPATREVLLAISAESRQAVDELADAAIAAGGSHNDATQDHGFMYGRSFDDIDGHTWEVTWMDADVAEGRTSPEEWAAAQG